MASCNSMDKTNPLSPAHNPREEIEIDQHVLRKTFDEFDLDHSGAVDFEGAPAGLDPPISGLSPRLVPSPLPSLLLPNPHWIDTYTELEAMVTSMGMILEPAELYDMLKEADEDGNEEIDFDEFSKVVSNAVKRIAEDPESRGKSFAGLIMRKAKTGPAMHWRTDKHGPNLSLSTMDGTMASPLLRRDADGGKAEVNQNGHAAGHWGVQLLDMRLSTAQYGLASVLLEVESSSASFMVESLAPTTTRATGPCPSTGTSTQRACARWTGMCLSRARISRTLQCAACLGKVPHAVESALTSTWSCWRCASHASTRMLSPVPPRMKRAWPTSWSRGCQ